MRRIIVTIAGTRYELAAHSDPQQVQQRITETVLDGGGFVPLTIVGEHPIKVLVSPALPASIETTDVPDTVRDGSDLEFPYFDTDLFHPAELHEHR